MRGWWVFGPIAVFSFFLFPLPLLAQTASHLVISQVQITGGAGQTENDFVEIYNPTSATIDLNGYRLVKRTASGTSDTLLKSWTSSAIVSAHGYYLWASKNYTTLSPAADVTIEQTLADNNGVALRLGAADTGAIIDSVAWGSATNVFVEGAAFAQNPGAGQSIERKPGGEQGNGEDSNNNNVDFLPPTASHPRNSQSPPRPSLPPPPLPPPTVTPGDIVINELADPVSGGNGWIELFNTTSKNSFDLSGFKIYDGYGSAIATLAGSISAGGFFVVDVPAIKLNNGGDTLVFKNVSGETIAIMTYGDWNDGNIFDNALAAADPNAVARKTDGQNSGNDAQDFAETTTPTKGTNNIISASQPPEPSPLPSFSVSDVIINEFLSNPSEGKEWIELYLNRSSDVLLDGWKIYDGTGNVIFSPTGTIISSARYAVFELSSARLNSARLNNDGDVIILKSPDGTTIDSVAYGNWNDGSITDNAPSAPKSGQSVSRKSNGGDTGVDSADFAVSDSPTKGVSNVITVTETVGGNSVDSKISTVPNALLFINEFVSDPADGEAEWVEVYNAGETSVDLAGWYLEEGSGGKTQFSGTSIPGQFAVAGPISGSLNNGGDVLYLKDPQGNIFDRVVYGSWDDGNVSDNAQVAADPASMARACDGCDTKNNSKDFRVSFTPTRGKGNVSLLEGETVVSAKIFISEFLPDPEGEEAIGEFIELQNKETRAVNLAGWYLKDASGARYVFGNVTVSAAGFFAVWRSQSKIALNNNKETVTLFAPDDAQQDQVISAAAKPGQSYALFDAQWQWTSEPTPGKGNVLKSQNHLPVISVDAPTAAKKGESVEIDAGDSSDPDGDALTFTWTVGDEKGTGSVLRRVFESDGVTTVTLEVSDGKEVATKDFTIAVGDSMVATTGGVFISEVLPDPEGSDAQEWLEVFYDGQTPMGLDGFQVDDAEGGSRPYVIKSLVAQPHSYLILERSLTGLAFNNEGDSVRLLDPAGKLLGETVYTKSSEGLSWSRRENGLFAWRAPTKGEKNSEQAVGDKKSGKTVVATEFSLTEVRDEPLGARVKVRGTVAVPPGVLGSQIFYLSGSGMQIYMNKKDFPNMKVGDVLEVEGELSEAQGERRIKVSTRESFKVISGGSPPVPHKVESADLGEEYEGNLVTVHGTVIETKGAKAVLDDGNGEVTISVKSGTGIDAGILSEGMSVAVTGIVSQRGEVYEILPRSVDDIEVLAGGEFVVAANEGTREEGKSAPYGVVTVGAAGALAAAVFRRRIGQMLASAVLFGLIRRPPGGGQNP